MPQISLYIDADTLQKVEYAAKQQHLSISKWVANQIKAKVEPVYPQEFYALFGSIQDDTFVRPEQPRTQDSPREVL
ncbi:MAG: hypothetical protein E6Q25_04725 [Acinetobacter sp.]|nr:MAG: hypothetical protein E6Q25_04725 [Acinetobacter sp.]